MKADCRRSQKVIISQGDTSAFQETTVCTRETSQPSGNKKKKGYKNPISNLTHETTSFQVPDPQDHQFPGPTACPHAAFLFSSLQIKSF
jgi:hypothetical protein